MISHNSRRLTVFIAIGVASAMHSARGDAWDPGDDAGTGATSLSMSESVQVHGPHNTTTQVDVADWFMAYLTAGSLYHFESTGDADMEAFLYTDAGGTGQVAYNDDISGSDFSFHIAYSPSVSGIYYLKVKQRFNASSVYSLSYYSDPPSTDAWDPGDDTGAGATVLEIDEVPRTNGVHVLSSGDTNDWFRFTLVAGNTYRFESSGDSDPQTRLYSDVDGTVEVASDDQSGQVDNFLVDYKPLVSGDYYLQVSSGVPGNYAAYTLNYRIVEDQWDPADDTGAGATLLSFAATNHGPHTLSTTDTNDWFRFSLVSGNTYYFETTVAVPAEQDTRGSLYSDAAGTSLVASDDDSGAFDNFLIAYTPSVSGDYYLEVEELYGQSAGYWLVYSMGVAVDTDGDGMPDEHEAIAGTNPTNPASYFAITNWSGNGFTIEWPAFANRQYQVYRSDSPTNAYYPVGPAIYYPQNSYTDSVSGAGYFYKVEVQLQ